MNNFRCPITGEEFNFAKYSIVIANGATVYKDKKGNQLLNPSNGVALEPIPKEGEYTTVMGSSVAESKKKLTKYLKDRSHKHFKQEIEPVRAKMNHDSIPGT